MVCVVGCDDSGARDILAKNAMRKPFLCGNISFDWGAMMIKLRKWIFNVSTLLLLIAGFVPTVANASPGCQSLNGVAVTSTLWNPNPTVPNEWPTQRRRFDSSKLEITCGQLHRLHSREDLSLSSRRLDSCDSLQPWRHNYILVPCRFVFDLYSSSQIHSYGFG